MPSDFKFDGNATPPNFTDSAGYKIEKGSRVRLKIMGVRAEIGSMYGVGTIKEVCFDMVSLWIPFIDIAMHTRTILGKAAQLSWRP